MISIVVMEDVKIIPDDIESTLFIIGNEVVEKISPFFEEIEKSKKENIILIDREILEIEEKIREKSRTLEIKNKELIEKKTTIDQLDKIEKLVSSRLIESEETIRELKIFIKSIGKISSEKVQNKISSMIGEISKKLSK